MQAEGLWIVTSYTKILSVVKKQMSEQKRLHYFDIAKGIGIILVIIGHIEYVDQNVRNVIVSFHMPLFFILSGMLMNVTNEKNRELKGLILRKAKRIMLVYLVFSILYPLIDILYYFVTGNGDPFGTLRINLVDSVLLYGNSVLWFLPALFFGEVIWLLLLKGAKKIPAKLPDGGKDILALAGALILMLSFFLPLWKSQNHLIQAFVRFFICAFLTGTGYGLYTIMKKRNIPAAGSAVLGAALLVFTCFSGKPNGTVDMHYAVYGNLFIFFFTAVCGSMGVIFLSKSLDGCAEAFPLRILRFYGVNSLIIMITHINFYILYVAEVLSFHFINYIPRAKVFLFNTMTVLFVLAGEFILIICWEKLKTAVLHRKTAF